MMRVVALQLREGCEDKGTEAPEGPGTGGMGATLPRAGRMGVVLGLGAPYSRAQRATSAFLPRAHKLTVVAVGFIQFNAPSWHHRAAEQPAHSLVHS